MKKRLVALTVAAMCAAGSVNTVFASTFSDINDVPWAGAAEYIDEAASLGLMSGYTENGKKLCKAKNGVTYCEAVQFIYSIMCSYNSANKVTSAVITKWTPTMQSANIPSWAYESVAYGLENEILSSADISIFMSSATQQRDARREDVGVIFGKALAKVYSVNQSASLNYADKSSFTSSSVPYIDLLNRLNLMVGDDNNNFNPKANINRAEMAVLSTKTYKELTGSGNTNTNTNTNTNVNVPAVNEQLVGAVTDVSDDSITVEVNGTEKTVKVSPTASITYNGDKGEIEDIKATDNAVIVVNDGVATFISAYPTYGTSSSSTITKGTITSLSKTRITIEQDGKKSTYKFDEDYNDVTLKLDGKTTKDIDDLIELVENGENIQAEIKADRNSYVTSITATTVEKNTLEGEITNITSTKITIKSGSDTFAYNLPDDTNNITVTLDGKSSTFDKVKAKYKEDNETVNVKLTLNSKKEVTKITATTEESSSTVSGTLSSISEDTIKIKTSSGGSRSYDITSNTTVKIDGSSSTVSKLITKAKSEDYTVKLTISGTKATKIEASAKDDADDYAGQIVSMDEDEIKIKVDGKTKSFDIKSGCEVKIDGKTSSLSSAVNKYDDGSPSTTWAYLTLNSSNKVTKISIDTDVEEADDKEGTIVSISDDDNEIKIKLSDGTTKKYTLSSSCKVTIDGTSSTVAKLEKKVDDDEVYTVELTVSSSKVTKIKASTSKGSVSGKIVSINEDNIKLGEKSSSGVYIGKNYPLKKNVKVYLDGDKIDLDEFIDKVTLNSYTAELERNSDGEVTKITATSTK